MLLPALAVCAFSAAFVVRFADPLIPDMARDFATTPQHMALIAASAFAFPYALAQLVLGPLSDAVGKGRVIGLSLIVLTVALAACALAPSTDALLVARIAAGAAAGGTVPVALAIVGDSVPPAERQIALSRLLMGMLSGHLFGTLGAGLIGDAFGWRAAMWCGAGLVAVASLIAIAIVAPRVAVTSRPFTPATMLAGFRSVLANPRAIVCYVAVMIGGTCLFGLLPHVAALLEARGAGSLKEAGLVIAAAGLGGIIYTLTVRRLLRVLGGQMNMIRLGGTIAAGGFAATALGLDWRLEALAFVVLGVGFYMVHNSLQTQATELSVTHRGSAVSLHAFAFFSGQALGPPLLGFGIATAGPAATLALAGLVMAATGFVLAAVLTRLGRAP